MQPSRRRFTVKRKMYSVDGTDQDWHFHTHGTLAYIVEGSHHNPKRTRVRDASILGIRPFFTGLLDRVLDGPRISGHITDDLGQPLEALITIDPMQTAADEKWTSRPRDGRYDRLVVEPGTYTVRATATGFQPIERRVTVRDNAVVVDLTLTAEERAASD